MVLWAKTYSLGCCCVSTSMHTDSRHLEQMLTLPRLSLPNHLRVTCSAYYLCRSNQTSQFILMAFSVFSPTERVWRLMPGQIKIRILRYGTSGSSRELSQNRRWNFFSSWQRSILKSRLSEYGHSWQLTMTIWLMQPERCQISSRENVMRSGPHAWGTWIQTTVYSPPSRNRRSWEPLFTKHMCP